MIENIQQDDEKLLNFFRAGDEAAFTAIFRRYRAVLHMQAFYILRDFHEAEDVTQEVFVMLWNKKQEINIDSSLKNYLIQATRNKCIDRLRRSQKISAYKDQFSRSQEESVNYLPFENAELASQLAAAINNIPAAATRKAFELFYLEDMSQKKIAAQLGITVGTVKNQVSRAVKILREKLDPNR